MYNKTNQTKHGVPGKEIFQILEGKNKIIHPER
jgi:hypothetical protein